MNDKEKAAKDGLGFLIGCVVVFVFITLTINIGAAIIAALLGWAALIAMEFGEADKKQEAKRIRDLYK